VVAVDSRLEVGRVNGVSVLLERIRAALEERRRGVALLLLFLFLANALVAALMNSGGGDELAAHIPSGYLYWISGTFSGGIDNFPLGQLLVTLPAGLLRVPFNLFTEEHLFLFRVVPILMGLGLCALVWRFTTKLYGRGAGLLALFFAALCPNTIAHSTLATLDLPVTFFIFLTVFLLDRYLEAPTAPRMAALSLALAAACLIKVQALLLAPYAVLVVLLNLRVVFASRRRARRDTLLSWLMMPAAGLILANLLYLHLPGHGGSLLPPLFTAALRGIVGHSEGGHTAYLLGNYSRQGWWYYFPIAVAVKTPLPEIALALFGLSRRQGKRETLLVTLPILLFLGAAMTSRINIGLRHLLMIYPFLAVAAGAGAVRLWKLGSGAPTRKDGGAAGIALVQRIAPLPRAAVGALLLATAAGAAGIAPHHLSYFNILAGGPTNGHKVLIDSNYDWGLNDRFLRRYIADHAGSYKIDPPAFRPVNGRIVINANALHGVLNLGPQAYKWLKDREPVDRIAYTWFVYDIPPNAFREEREDTEARAYVLAHLFARADAAAAVAHPGYRTILARGFAETAAFDVAFSELRAVLAEDPTYAPALALGGEITIRKKLGVLYFRGDEYLSGFRTQRPSGATADDTATLVALARRGGLAGSLSRVESDLGNVLLQTGDRARAAASFNLALSLDPANGAARQGAR
jgi:hypothetical protein